MDFLAQIVFVLLNKTNIRYKTRTATGIVNVELSIVLWCNSVAWRSICYCYCVSNEYVKHIVLVVEVSSSVLALDDLEFKYSTVFILPAAAQICSLPVERGRCRALMRRFFFNSTSRQCEEFRFGGCEGNANRFDTEKECNDFCGCELC